MSVKENIIEIKPMKIDINDIFDKKIELSPLLEFTLLQKIIEEFINRQKETNNKIIELEKQISSIKTMPVISPKDNFLLNNMIEETSEENDLKEIENLNKDIEIKQNIETNKEKEEKETEEEKEEVKEDVKEEKKEDKKEDKKEEDKEIINKETIDKDKEDDKVKTLLQSNKENFKKSKFYFQQITGKVNILENKYNELLEQFISLKKESKKEIQTLKNKDKENATKITELENLINEMQNKKEEEIDNMKVINEDEGDIEIDKDKVQIWIKNLEQKVMKKIELSDRRNKNNEGSLNEIKKEIEDLKNKINNLNSILSANPKEKEAEKNEEKEEEKKDLEDDNKDNINIFDTLATKEELNKLKDEFQKKIEEVNDNITKNPLLNIDEQKLYEMIIPKMGQMSQNLKENVVKSIENNEKYVKNQIKKLDIDSLKAELSAIKKDLNNKLNKENLGSINLKLEDIESFGENLRTLIDDNKNDIRLCNDKYSKLFKVLETLRGQVLTLFEEEYSQNKKDKDDSKLDIALLVSRQDYDEDKSSMNKKIDKIFSKESDNYRMIQEIQRKIRNLITETDLQNLEQYLLNIISENKLKISKNYVEKSDLQKALKFIEIRIKTLEEAASKENENWLLAKKPINGFLCASCEAYIGDLKNNSEFSAWNKLSDRKGRKNYRIGHGFSTMLKMINSDILKRFEKEKESSNKNNNSVINNSNPFKLNEVKKIHKNLPKINITNQANNNETQNVNVNNSHSEEVNENLNNSLNNLKTHTQVHFDRNTLNIKGQLSDRVINKNKDLNFFNKDIIENMTNEEIHPKVIKISKQNKNV